MDLRPGASTASVDTARVVGMYNKFITVALKPGSRIAIVIDESINCAG